MIRKSALRSLRFGGRQVGYYKHSDARVRNSRKASRRTPGNLLRVESQSKTLHAYRIVSRTSRGVPFEFPTAAGPHRLRMGSGCRGCGKRYGAQLSARVGRVVLEGSGGNASQHARPLHSTLEGAYRTGVGYGLALEGASSADLVKSVIANSEPAARKGKVA